MNSFIFWFPLFCPPPSCAPILHPRDPTTTSYALETHQRNDVLIQLSCTRSLPLNHLFDLHPNSDAVGAAAAYDSSACM